MRNHLIFDLDGTLIDSAPSILTSYAHTFASMGIAPKIPLTSEVIGPPLMQTLAKLSGIEDLEILKDLAQRFKSHYDTEGHKQTLVYAGAEQFLKTQQAAGFELYIATNKRHVPTVKIMQHLGWTQYFSGIFALDYYTPAMANKGQMLSQILSDLNIAPKDALYIGDRYEDGIAAEQNDLPFVLVSWGYFNEEIAQAKAEWKTCATLAALGDYLHA
ncbi:MAG TPA: HAD hydrolase-like protein [Methylophilaceae bacterium]|jgi:phosphoglycolate phosphatase